MSAASLAPLALPLAVAAAAVLVLLVDLLLPPGRAGRGRILGGLAASLLAGVLVASFLVDTSGPAAYGAYHGGAWAIHTVTFNVGVTPYLLTSDEDVADAEAAGDVTVTRHPELDNRCPIMP